MSDDLDITGAVDGYLGGKGFDPSIPVRQSVAGAIDANPQYEVDLARAAKRTGVSMLAARAAPEEVKRQAMMQALDFGKLVTETPRTAAYLLDQDNARKAHDDIGALATFEAAAVKAARYMTSADAQGGFVRDLLGGALYGGNAGAAGVFRAAAEFIAPPLDVLERFPSIGGNPLRRAAEGFGMIAADSSAKLKALSGTDESIIGGGVTSGVQSLGQNLMTLPLALLPGGQAAVLFSGAGMQGGQSYNKARDKGIGQNTALGYGLSDAVIEYATEKLPLHRLIGDVKAGAPLLKALTKNAALEIPGEQIATVLQDMNEWAVLNPDKPFKDYLAERPSAAAQTLIATLIGTGGQVSLLHAVQGVADTATGTQRQAAATEQRQQALGELLKLAEASKLRERDPEAFATFAQSLVENNTPNLYVDPRELVKAGVDMAALAQSLPSIASQLDVASQTGGDLVIPTGEFLAAAPGQAYLQPLLEHARTATEAMSPAEARVYMQEHGDKLQTEVERVLAERQGDETFSASRNEVRDSFLAQLNTANRFTPDVNTAYATLIANFYAVQAARLGMTPADLAQRYPLRVGAESVVGSRVMDQGPLSLDALRQSWSDAGLSHSIREKDGTILLDRIVVPTEGRDQGRGTTAMRQLAQYADATGQRVELSPSTDFGASSRGRLVNFYKQFGFVENKGRAKDFTTRAGMIRQPVKTLDQSAHSAVPEALRAEVTTGATTTPEFKAWFGGSKVTTADGQPRVVYHGTGRPDRVGERFRKDRATAGPMAFFTDDAQIGSKYATDKQDTSIALEGALNYENWFLLQTKDGPLNLDKAWASLPASERVKIRERAPQIKLDDDTGEQVVHDPKATRGNGGYLPATNPLMALKASWLDSGELFDHEQKFIEVLKLAGLRASVEYQSPYDTTPAVVPVYLSINKPLVTSDITSAEVEALRVASQGQEAGIAGVDQWAKDSVSGAEWMMRLDEDVKNGTTHAWTSVPDWVTAVLRGLGYDGIQDTGGKRGGQTHGVWVPFDETQIKSATGNRGTYDANDPNILHQSARGQIALADDITKTASVITLLKGADLSTFLHESGHFFLEVQADLAGRIQGQILAGASVTEGEREIVADMNRLLDWFGVKGSPEQTALDAWHAMPLEEKRQHHEQFARGFEAYAFEGRAPSLELQSTFQRFRAWLVNIYQELKTLNVTLTDEVRSVLDRMVASGTQIQEAEAARSMGALFKTPEQAGMTLEEFKAYHELALDATQQAIQNLEARGLRDMQWLSNARSRTLKDLQKRADTIRREVERGVRAEVMSQPVYQVWQFLTQRGERVKAGELRVDQEAGQQTGKLRTSAVKEINEAGLSLLQERRMLQEKDGLHPDVVADLFGFSSGDEMIKALVDAQPPRQVIEGMTDQRMLESHGDLGTPEGLQRATDQAVHNEARGRFMATELAALERAGSVRENVPGRRNTVDVLARQAKATALAVLARLRVRDIKPGQYAAAEVRAARAAEKALAGGKLEDAAAEKRNQMIQSQAARAAYAAQDEVRAAVDYLRRFEKRPQSVDPLYLDQIEALLERFDLNKGTSLKALDKRKTLMQWVESQLEQGMEPVIPPELLNEALRQSWRDMTLEQLRGLRDTVRQIEHLGRLKNRLLTAKEQREFTAIRDEIAQSIIDHAGDRQADTRTPATTLGRALKVVKDFGAAHIKAATWARVFDGGKDGGPVWEYLIRSANERGDQETTMRGLATAALHEIIQPLFDAGKMHGKGTYFAELKRSMNREQVIAMALNIGNEGNIQRMLGGEGWTMAQIMPVLSTLTAADWHAVQAIWDHFESYRSAIGAKEKRVYGTEPNWVELLPSSISTADGQVVALRGGYYPIKYDPLASNRAEQHNDAEAAKRQLQGAYTSATTRRGFTKSRVEEVNGRPLLYSLAGVYSGINDVIHDLAWNEWLIDANKILRSDKIDGAIREHYGPAAVRQLKTWVSDVAAGEQGLQAELDGALGRLRHGVSVAGLGFNVMSALMQPLGLTQSIVRVGAPWIAKGMTQYIASPINKTREVNDKSEFMAGRARTRFRELNELRNQVEGQTETRRMISATAYFLMMRCQQMVDTPTWLGAYEKAVSEGNAEERAVALADQAVIDAQGGGQTKDLSAIERGGPPQKLFTVFYSFMNTALNAGVAKTMAADTPAKKAKLAVDYAMLYVVPAVLGVLLKDALTPGSSGDGDDWRKLARKLLGEQLGYLMGLMVITREFSEAGKTVLGLAEHPRDYSGPAGLRPITDAYALGKQVLQGEFDTQFRKAAVNLVGDMFALPAAQVNRTITGVQALHEGKTTNPAAVLFGYQEPH